MDVPPLLNPRSMEYGQSIQSIGLRRRAIELSAFPAAAGVGRSSMSLPPSNPGRISIPHLPAASTLYKHNSWSQDLHRDEAWQRQMGRRNRRSRSVTDDDLDELKACIELGFGFDSEKMDPRLSDTLPAYGLYYTVNKQYNDAVSKPSPSSPATVSPAQSECGTPSPLGSPHTIFAPGDNPQTVKTRLRQWAQVVACSVRQSPS